MVNEGDSPQGGHELNFGSTPQDPPAPPPGAPEPPSSPEPPAASGAPGAPETPAAPETPSYSVPAPGEPSGAHPAAPYGAAPAQPAAYPGQPGPSAGQPGGHQGQPYGAQPGPAYGGQPGQGYPGQPGGPQPPKKSSQGLLWGLIGGGVVVLIAVVLVVALLVVPAITRSSVSAADAVKGYLMAVSKSDAKTALSYLQSVPNKDLLTDAVLKESHKLAPISRISVRKGSENKYSGTVRATYELGDKTVSTTYQLYKVKDAWKIINGAAPVSLDALRGLDATINGVPTAKLADAYVFPGMYEIALDSTYFSLDGDATFPITSSEDAAALYDLRTKLNDTGVTKYRALVRAAVEACVALKTLSTPCGMDITSIDLSGATPVDGTVTRTLTAAGSAKLDTLQPESNGSSPTVVSSYDSIDVDMSLQGSDGNTYTVLFGGYLDRPTVDLGAADPTVTWE